MQIHKDPEARDFLSRVSRVKNDRSGFLTLFAVLEKRLRFGMQWRAEVVGPQGRRAAALRGRKRLPVRIVTSA